MTDEHRLQTFDVRYTGMIYREKPETRWFRRLVLRRKVRRTLFHAGPIDNFTLQRELNGITNSSVVFADPMERLAQFRLPADDFEDERERQRRGW